MLVCNEAIRGYLGIPSEPLVTETEALIESSALQAQTLVSAYVGYPVEQDMQNQKTVTHYQLTGVRVVRLDEFPAKPSSVKLDDVELQATDYTFDSRLGVLHFKSSRPYIEKLEIKYSPGFTVDTVPADMLAALENITIAIYENGGKVPAAPTSGELKSMTMFDAMSMSFETGGATSGDAGTPEGLVKQWAFALDKYRVDQYVMK